MTTITLKINERTKAGKTLKNLIELFLKENNGVEVVSDESNPIIGYSGKGEPLTIKALNTKLKRAEKDYKSGRTTSDEDLAKEIETW